MGEKKTFILPTDKMAKVDALSDEDAGKLFKLIFAYECGETDIPDGTVGTAFVFGFQDWLDQNRKKYEQTCVKNQTNGNKGGRPPKKDDSLFDRFWSAYPRKSAKEQARKAFKKITAKQLEEVILPDLEKRKRSAQWTENNGMYVPYPATYLNGERWNDEIRKEQNKRGFEERKVTDEDFSDMFLTL